VSDEQRYTLGVDIGGTFTDLVLVDGAGRTRVGKVLTTPEAPEVGVLRGVERLLAGAGVPAERLAHAVHATTLISNAIIERKGARTGLLTTRGFRDLLEIGRETKYDLYDLFLERPEPLVPRPWRLEVDERMGVDGDVVTPLEPDGAVVAVERLLASGVEAVAVCFLHSYVNPEHELRVGRALAERFPELAVTLSCVVAREIREYERCSTAVANAYVQPLAGRYLGRLEDGLAELGCRARLSLMVSNGGITSVAAARAAPVRLLESGPAAGALVAAFFGEAAGQRHVLAFDMGGTTAKACLVDDGRPATTYTFEAGRQHRFKKGSGLPIRAATIELIEIGAGGGSLARIDELGLLQVGPASAGAEPGPACYGRGGEQPTVTDADVLLGYVDPDSFLGGAMRLDRAAAEGALRRHLAEPLGLDPLVAARGVHDLVNENMANAARVHLAEKGRDPRRYTLLATGGAAPVHAYGVARKLLISRLYCPPAAGVASTFGLLVAPPRVDLVASYVGRLDALDWGRVEALYEEMIGSAAATLDEVSVPREAVTFERAADMRYVGQGFEIPVPVPARPLRPEDRAELEARFHRAYVESFARDVEGVPIEALNWRLIARGPRPPARFAEAGVPGPHRDRQGPTPDSGTVPLLDGRGADSDAGRARKGSRPAYFAEADGFVDTPVYDRYRLAPGMAGVGPAIVEERESTLVIGPSGRFRVDERGGIMVEID
jgi:N-methylhydantoinase A